MNAAGFTFKTVNDIVSELGSSQRLAQHLKQRFDANKVWFVTDQFLSQQPSTLTIVNQLRQNGYEVHVDNAVIPDPPEAVVLETAQRAKAFGAQLVIGFGGGSSMDVAKLIAVLAISDQPLNTMYGIGNCKGPRLPLIQIPTTAGTGSEVTPIAIVTTGETTKMGVVSPVLYADLAVLDAELTVGLPKDVTAATGIDAMVHAIEAYTSKHLKNPYSDLLAKEALRLLSGNLQAVCDNGYNLAARQAMLLGSMLAGQAFANSPCAAVHALAYPIGGYFHVPHGLSNALVLAQVMKFNAPMAQTQYAELADVVLPNSTGTVQEKSDEFVQWCGELSRQTGIQTCLRDVGIAQGDLNTLADSAMLQTRLLNNNPRTLNRDDAYAIYAASL